MKAYPQAGNFFHRFCAWKLCLQRFFPAKEKFLKIFVAVFSKWWYNSERGIECALNTTDVLCEDIFQCMFRRGANFRFALLFYETEVAQVERMNPMPVTRFWGVGVLIGLTATPQVPTTKYAALFPCGFVRRD